MNPKLRLRNADQLSRKPPDWVPASEVRGEGIFLQFNEEVLSNWLGEKATSRTRKGIPRSASTLASVTKNRTC